MSSTLRATTTQPRSLLSMARLNIAKSRIRPSTWSFVRIDQTCFGRSGGFAPISLPLFQAEGLDVERIGSSRSCMTSQKSTTPLPRCPGSSMPDVTMQSPPTSIGSRDENEIADKLCRLFLSVGRYGDLLLRGRQRFAAL